MSLEDIKMDLNWTGPHGFNIRANVNALNQSLIGFN